MKTPRPVLLALLVLFSAGISRAWAYLGGFEQLDGYHISMNGGVASSQVLVDAGEFTMNGYLPTAEYSGIGLSTAAPDFRYGPDVSRYNAGQYTTSLPLDIRDGTGLWVPIYGGRPVEDDFSAPWDGWGSDYIAATSARAHQGNQSMAMRAMDDRLIYNYRLDARDILPSTPAYQMSFWLTPSAADNTYQGNVFGLSLNDDSGVAFFEVGYTGDDFLQYRVRGDSAWTNTAFQFGNGGWSEISLSIDASVGAFSLSGQSFDDATGTLNAAHEIISSRSFGIHPGSLTSLSYQLQGGYLGDTSLNEAHYFDDFAFAPVSVPEPGSAILAALAAIGLFRRRRR